MPYLNKLAGIVLRAACEADMPAIATLYRHYVDHTVSTFAAPGEFTTPAAMTERWAAGQAKGYPWIVATLEDGDTASHNDAVAYGIPADIGASPGAFSPGYVCQPALPPKAVIGPTRLLGYCYVGDFRPRAGWAITVEDSIYLAPGWSGLGLGSAMLTALIDGCKSLATTVDPAASGKLVDAPVRNIVAAISADSADASVGAASVALHSRHGFVPAGRLLHCGTKFGRSLDNVFLQLQLFPPPQKQQ